MRLNILSDADWEAKLEPVLHELSGLGYRSFFDERDYGPGVSGVTVVFMCQDPSLDLKPRIKFSKKEKKFYMDIMLNLPEMKAANVALRKAAVIEGLLKTVPAVVRKYKIDEFESARFLSDFDSWFRGLEWV